MKITTFAAIYIGSYEVSMKVFEIRPGRKIRQVDYVRSRLELGLDAYSKGVIGYELVEDLCQVLKEFRSIMDGYKVDTYKAYAGNMLRTVSNGLFILEQIRIRTKLEVTVASNSELRFLSYESMAASPEFEKMIGQGAVVVEVGGGSMQITLFQKGTAVTTQHIELGIMRIWEKLSKIRNMVSHYETQIQELIDKELEIFKRLYLEGQDIKYVILMGDYIGEMVKGFSKKQEDGTIESERFLKLLNKWHKKSPKDIAVELNLVNENDPLILPSVVLYKRLTEEMNADFVWVPGVSIDDGIVCDYAQKNHMIRFLHDFDQDILAASKNLAERYQSYSEHTESVLSTSTAIFDAMKKVHGMDKRERLLLQVAAILHDCGRYVSLTNQFVCSYQIIMASEIIGMTDLEREIVASTVKYNSLPRPPYERLRDKMDKDSYVVVSKLTAILKIANAMDRSHKQKFENIKAALKGKELIITIETKENTVLEKGLFSAYVEAFEEVFSIMPKIKEKRVF